MIQQIPQLTYNFCLISEPRSLLKIKPVHKKQQENFDRVLKCITHLLYLLLATAKTDAHKQMVGRQLDGKDLYALNTHEFPLSALLICPTPRPRRHPQRRHQRHPPPSVRLPPQRHQKRLLHRRHQPESDFPQSRRCPAVARLRHRRQRHQRK
jgi:hypothetical protein